MANRPLLLSSPDRALSLSLPRSLLASFADYSALRWLASSRINATPAGDKQQIFNCTRVCTDAEGTFIFVSCRTDGWMRDRANPARVALRFFATRVVTSRPLSFKTTKCVSSVYLSVYQMYDISKFHFATLNSKLATDIDFRNKIFERFPKLCVNRSSNVIHF